MPVAARFHGLRDRVVSAVDQRFAEPVRLSFMKNGRSDPARPQMIIEAPLRTGGNESTVMTGGQASVGWRSRISAGKAELHIDRTTYAGPMLQPGDAVRAIARPGEPLFEVLSVDDRDHTRLIVALGEA